MTEDILRLFKSPQTPCPVPVSTASAQGELTAGSVPIIRLDNYEGSATFILRKYGIPGRWAILFTYLVVIYTNKYPSVIHFNNFLSNIFFLNIDRSNYYIQENDK